MCPTSIIRESKGLGKEQMALVTMDVFAGQVTLEIKEVLQENSILATNVPTNKTRFYQPFDLPINGSAKGFIATKFNGWCSELISEELQSGTPLEDIGVKLRLSILKSLHAGWETDFYDTSAEGKKIILNGWKATSIYDAIRLGIGKLPTVDPYHDIDRLVNESNIPVAKNLEAVVCLIKTILIYSTPKKIKMKAMIMKNMRGNQKFKPQTLSTFFRIFMTSNLCKITFLVLFLNIILIDNWKKNNFFFLF